ncbi:MAG: glycosyltransferase family 25 protein [Zoogloea sp.]|uniref:glycosyltransferase family 25 protein n=1 Tax=Zoogloea sp. TaxID=49181 RepID=UPI00263A1657|nr:glycosyltransferase family 25 protein [Zoogloea sp.]MDD3327073.1 glycosyltransferase family 25 protein [Zoogloea sp.]
MKIFVLNLERALERRESMLQHLSSLGIEAEILPAVEGARLPASSLPAGTDARLSPGEIGCYLSHVRFWEIVVERGLEHAIVLEDDVRCSPSMLQVAEDVAALGMPFDAVRLSALNPIRGLDITTLPHGGKLVLPNKNPSGTQGYMVTLEGARHLLERLAVPRCPIDTALDAYWKHGLCIPLVSPSVVAEDAGIASSIEGRFGRRQRKTLGRHLARVAEAQRRKFSVFLMARRLRARLQRRAQGNPAQ